MSEINGAQFSNDRLHRLALWRTWREEPRDTLDIGRRPHAHEFVMFVGLNPSLANETDDDPTIRKCIGFAKRWGYGGIYMLNLFTRIETSPKLLELMTDKNHAESNSMLTMYANSASLVIAAWGAEGFAQKRALEVSALLADDSLHAFGVNKDGSPKHPLYLPYTMQPKPWEPAP